MPSSILPRTEKPQHSMAFEAGTELPVSLAGLPQYIAEHPQVPIVDILDPYRKYEAYLRTVYAQDRQNPLLDDPYLNVIPLFTGDTRYIVTRARNLIAESEEEKSKYIMPLSDDKRRPNNSPAIVTNLEVFSKNFNIFSEFSLTGIDWNNIVAAGSSVVNTLVLVPKEYEGTNRKLREYYHEKVRNASSAQLLMSIFSLSSPTYPGKHPKYHISMRLALIELEIVLRIYKSVSEILTGFDIDAAGVAYDGKQVYATPRALSSFITQINHIDLTRRSPSYENRLSKYSHRNFEVYWPELDRSRVDAAIYERRLERTFGLARLLIMERLPTGTARDEYLNKLREARGKRKVSRQRKGLRGNIKEDYDDEVADWRFEEDISDYHTFSMPYGRKFDAKRIEKLAYSQDLLLNAEWNQRDRTVSLHRHPVFFGCVEDVVEDCCGLCPVPQTDEEKEVAEKEAEIYISGKLTFITDDPGRQQIGSFNPLTEHDWTDMAYTGNSARLFQSIIDGNVDDVRDLLLQEGPELNKRDHTGRAPLHLAVMASTPEVVQVLLNHGARLTSRLANGETALHLAASRGDTAIIRLLMEKSIKNEQARQESEAEVYEHDSNLEDRKSDSEDEASIGDDGTEWSSDDSESSASSEDDADYFQIDVTAGDVPCAPLHLAIANGHNNAVKLLCDYEANLTLPLEIADQKPNSAVESSTTFGIYPLALALTLPRDRVKPMVQLLLKLGATASQADPRGLTVFQRFAEHAEADVMHALISEDTGGVKKSISHIVVQGWSSNPQTIFPLHSATERGDVALVMQLLANGAEPHIESAAWIKATKVSLTRDILGSPEYNKNIYQKSVEQPIIAALRAGIPEVVFELLERGADPNVMSRSTATSMIIEYRRRFNKGRLALDIVRGMLSRLETLREVKAKVKPEPKLQPGMDSFLAKFSEGTYQHWLVAGDIEGKRAVLEQRLKAYRESNAEDRKVASEYEEVINELVAKLRAVEEALLSHGARTYEQLYPDIKTGDDNLYKRNSNADEEDVTPYKHTFTFIGEDEIVERGHEGYIKLFEAAWTGDLDCIKALTTQAWGPQQDQPPLIITMKDKAHNTPFSLAFLRGHYAVARAILEIAKAQWAPMKVDQVHRDLSSYLQGEERRKGANTSQSESDDDNGDGDDNDNDQFSELELQVTMQAKSHKTSLGYLLERVSTFKLQSTTSVSDLGVHDLFEHCMAQDDAAGLKLLLEFVGTYSGKTLNREELRERLVALLLTALKSFPSARTRKRVLAAMRLNKRKLLSKIFMDEEYYNPENEFTFPIEAFMTAIRLNKTQMLSLVVKQVGVGIPLDHLLKVSVGGVPTGGYNENAVRIFDMTYQGLTVYGKKRKDWAAAGRGMVVHPTGIKAAPLLHAALFGALESVEYFLSDAPYRHYSEFGKSIAAREDPRMQHFVDDPTGFDRAISTWLSTDNDLVIHCAVMAEPSQEAKELLQYLVEACPSSLERRDSDGNTPLLNACILGRRQAVETLIGANADQATKNYKGENVLHALLRYKSGPSRLEAILELFDQDLLRNHISQQRQSLQGKANTPLHSWISKMANDGSSNSLSAFEQKEMLTLLLRYTSGKELELLNCEGNTPLHTAVEKEYITITGVLVRHKPALLFQENVAGRTVFDIAKAQVNRWQFRQPYADRENWEQDLSADSLLDKLHNKQKKKTRSAEMFSAKRRDEITAECGLSREYCPDELYDIVGSLGYPLGRSEPKSEKYNMPEGMAAAVVLDICTTAIKQHPAKRRLVSVNEANDVLQRLLGDHLLSCVEDEDGHGDEKKQSEGEGEDGAGKDNEEVDFVVERMRNSRKVWERRHEQDVDFDAAPRNITSFASECAMTEAKCEINETLLDWLKGLNDSLGDHNTDGGSWERITSSISLKISVFKTWSGNNRARSIYLAKRAEAQMQACLNLMAQRDGALNHKKTKAALRDSSDMRAIAWVTLAFLPATFVAFSALSTTVSWLVWLGTSADFSFRDQSVSSIATSAVDPGAASACDVGGWYWAYWLASLQLMS
ncbi:ankyrin repeat [Fusarium pseudocircinatum]|uniref:Ankyrin repeat n=1 Tax=Fusarium pseudocircinatum TaxID=56676 RepID=A0A8H5KMB0_9HYPO|nr:ankyrin repeat [Fusarium pseudocircinatum]